MVITHPFHPKAGKEYRLVGINKSQGKEKLRCQDEDSSEFLVPSEYTNFSNGTFRDYHPAVNVGDFCYDDLVVLSGIIRDIMC